MGVLALLHCKWRIPMLDYPNSDEDKSLDWLESAPVPERVS